ncbi:ribonuclease H-like domain-containing protein [Tanacetum coccineum]
MDEIVESKNMDVITIVTPSNGKKVELNHESAGVKSNGDIVEPKTVRKNSYRPPVIEDWNSNDDSEVEFIPNVKDKTVRPSTEKIKSARETVEKVIRPVWNNSSRVNHKNFANKMTHPHPNRRFVRQAGLTRSGKNNTAGVSVNTAVKPINIAGSKPTMNHPRPISNAYKKGYSQVTRPFNKYSANKNNIFNKKVNTIKVKDTTARDRAVGNPHRKEYKEKGVIDSGCSRHMTGNKCYLTQYKDYDGGFFPLEMVKVEFLEKVKSKQEHWILIMCKGKIKTGTLDFDNVYFCKELKYNLFSAFLYGTIEEEVYVCQPPGFEDPQFPDKVYKVEKALYGLHQAPRAWYETLSTYLIENRFRRGIIDKTLFIKKDKGDILFDAQEIPDEFYGELTFFLGLQVQQKKDGIFIIQDKYVADILKKFGFATMKTASVKSQ